MMTEFIVQLIEPQKAGGRSSIGDIYIANKGKVTLRKEAQNMLNVSAGDYVVIGKLGDKLYISRRGKNQFGYKLNKIKSGDNVSFGSINFRHYEGFYQLEYSHDQDDNRFYSMNRIK